MVFLSFVAGSWLPSSTPSGEELYAFELEWRRKFRGSEVVEIVVMMKQV